MEKFLRDGFDHVIPRNSNMKQFQVIARDVLLLPDEINDIFVDINDDLQINVNIYNGLKHKA